MEKEIVDNSIVDTLTKSLQTGLIKLLFKYFRIRQNRAKYSWQYHFIFSSIGSHVCLMFIVMSTPIEAATRNIHLHMVSLQNAWNFIALYFMISKQLLNCYSIWCGNRIYHFCTLRTLQWAHTTTIIISYLYMYEPILSFQFPLGCYFFFVFLFCFYYGPFLLPTRRLNIICVNKTSKCHNKFTYSIAIDRIWIRCVCAVVISTICWFIEFSVNALVTHVQCSMLICFAPRQSQTSRREAST